MCGIAGIVFADPSRPCPAETVTAMRDIASYRGPDDAGLYLDGPAGLGHRRLSIIDLGGGHQPMSHGDGRFWIIFNGEIYNYRELRRDLAARGSSFRTQSDTEVILHLYAERRERCVEALNGMFAFAIWDRDRRTLFLARDRMGVKPLYYADTPEAFVFGSEIKSIFASGVVTPERRDEALREYLIFRQVAGPDTMFRKVKAVPPGHIMTVAGGEIQLRRYWSPVPDAVVAPASFAAARDELTALLEDSVRLRLISDVPVGTFCSGGVDSSLVTALAARVQGDRVNTYSVGFDDADFDESTYAQTVSKQYHTMHHQLRVGNEPFADLVPRMVWHNDEPLDFANSVHIFALSVMAKKDVTVVLTGEGSDELFGGYPRYRIPHLTHMYRRVPAFARKLAGCLLNDHRLAKLERYAHLGLDDVLLFNASYLHPDLAAQLAPTSLPFASAYRTSRLNGNAPNGLDAIGRLSLMDQETFLVAILHRQDKMSMAASIESRVPFMDYRVVEWANRLPSAYRVRRGVGKALVKEVAKRLLPASIVDRRKSGFGVPLARWFRSEAGLGAMVRDLADRASADVFDRSVLRRLDAEHRAGTHDHSEALWTVLNVCLWREAYRV